MNQREILQEISEALVEMFELDPEVVTMESRLVEDLDLDSIDAIDMAVKIHELTGRRLEEEQLQEIKTVGDVVGIIERMQTAEPGR